MLRRTWHVFRQVVWATIETLLAYSGLDVVFPIAGELAELARGINGRSVPGAAEGFCPARHGFFFNHFYI